ncbi:MAG: hypothetical protein LBJ23_00155 [Tannerella sp.]|jgi:hypothetical protein|nr:hypothetical protein [Tannerella sp.]
MELKMNKYGIVILTLGMLCLWGCSPRRNRILREIEIQNRQLPKKINDVLQVDSLHYDDNTKTLGYYYTVSGDSCGNMQIKDYGEVRKSMATEIRKSPKMAVFRAQKITFEYVYLSGKDKSPCAKIIIEADMYK